MKGIALLVGLAATALGASTATSYFGVSSRVLACSLLALVAYEAPLLRLPSPPSTPSQVRVASPSAAEGMFEKNEDGNGRNSLMHCFVRDNSALRTR